jgi:hypothetical protein
MDCAICWNAVKGDGAQGEDGEEAFERSGNEV